MLLTLFVTLADIISEQQADYYHRANRERASRVCDVTVLAQDVARCCTSPDEFQNLITFYNIQFRVLLLWQCLH